MEPSLYTHLLVLSFPKTLTTPSEASQSEASQIQHPSSVDLITTKQNKLPYFIDR